MTCREREEFQHKDREIALKNRTIARLRDMHRYFDRLMDGIVIMLAGIGVAAFLYAVMDFIRWMIGA